MSTKLALLVRLLVTLVVVYFLSALVPSRASTLSANTSSSITASDCTGFFINYRGQLMTAAHCIQKTDRVTVLIGNKEHEATLVVMDTRLDIAILDTHTTPKTWAVFNTQSIPHQGVSVLGTVDGEVITISTGHLDRSGEYRKVEFLFSTVKICQGNSGGVLLNKNGQVIGMNVMEFFDKGTPVPKCSNSALSIGARALIDFAVTNGVETSSVDNDRLFNTDLTTISTVVLNNEVAVPIVSVRDNSKEHHTYEK